MPVWFVNIGERIRICLFFALNWRPVLWLQMGKDGSIYVSPRYEEITYAKTTSHEAREGSVTINYDEGDEITDKNAMKAAKASFHASGFFQAGGQRLWGFPLRTLSEQRHLCNVLLEHPAAFSPIPFEDIRKRDVCLDYKVDKSSPLEAVLYVAPKEALQIVPPSPGTRGHVNLAFCFRGQEETPDLCLQMVLRHGPPAPWPPGSYIVIPGSPGTDS